MRLPDFLSAFTLNIILALISIIMAIVALAVLALALAKDGHLKLAPSTTRDKLRRHESVIVDLKDPKTVPEDFLQLDTLMFDKRTKNNQITHMSNALPLPGMETMPLKKKSTDEKTFPLLAENEDVESNRIISIPRSQRSVTDEYIRINSSQSPLVSDSAISNDQYLSNVSTLHKGESEKNTTNVTSEGSGWIEERVTIEPLAEKIIVNFECASNFSLC